MKLLFPTFLITVCALLVIVACHKPEEVVPESNDVTVTGKIIPSFGIDELHLDSVYTLSNGVKVKINSLKFFFSNVTLGGTQMIDYSLFDFGERGTAWFTKTGEFSVGTALNYGIGVDGTANHADPTACSPSSWLYVTNANDLHWSWNQGYIFISIDGKADTLVDATTNCNWSFSYHIGDNHFYTPGQSQTMNPVQTGSKQYEIKLKLDIKNFFENPLRPINLATEYLTHSAPADDDLSEKVRLNFAEAFSPL